MEPTKSDKNYFQIGTKYALFILEKFILTPSFLFYLLMMCFK